MSYIWKQWKGFKKLHAIEWHGRINNSISACRISQPFDFVVPSTDVKCKNCEREMMRYAGIKRKVGINKNNKKDSNG